MSRKRPRTASVETVDNRPSPILAADYNGRRVVLFRNPDYQETLALIKRVFRSLAKIPNHQIVLSAHFDEPGLHCTLEIPGELWAETLPKLKFVYVNLEEDIVTSDEEEEIPIILAGGKDTSRGRKILVTLEVIEPRLGRKIVKVSVSIRRRIVEGLSPTVFAQAKIARELQAFFFRGRLIDSGKSFQSEGIDDGDTITVKRRGA